MYVSKRMIAALLLAAAAMLPAAHVGAVDDPAVYGAGEHTEGMTKVLHLPNGEVRVLGQLTTAFSIDGVTATCMVGEAGGEFAPMNMIMYTTEITSRAYGTDAVTGAATYTIAGLVRSITSIGGITIEDVVTPFTVTATDGDPTGVDETVGDFFHMSIDTSLWPHTTFGRDLTGESIPIFGGDVAIGHPIAGA